MSRSVAIVTGASQGIGRATAIRLARDFSALVLVRGIARIWKRPPRRRRPPARKYWSLMPISANPRRRQMVADRRWPRLAASMRCSISPALSPRSTCSR